MKTTIMFLLATVAACAYCAVDYSDYVSLRGTGVTAIDAFMTNVVDKANGWSDERDPHDDADYVVKSGSRLGTPVDDTTSTCYEFPGRSLTIDSTYDVNRGLLFYTRNNASVKFKRLTLSGGVIAVGVTGTMPQTIRGDVVVDLSDKAKPFRFKDGTAGRSWHFRDGSLSSGCDDVLEMTESEVKSIAYWIHSDMDASAYYGTLRVDKGRMLFVECPRFGGTAEATVTGIVSYAASDVSISNVWLSSAGAKLKFDADGYSAGADRLVMAADTVVEFRAGTTLTVGTLDCQGGTLDFTNGGLLALTNSYSRSVPINLVVPLVSTEMRTAVLVTMPASVGELRPEDFVAAQTVGNCQYQFRVRTVDGLQSLFLENLLPCGTTYSTYQNSDAYVHQILGGYSGSAPVDVFARSGAWSNKTDGVSAPVPTSDKAADLDYEGVRLGFWGSQNVDFKGRSFTYSGYPIRATANSTTYTFPDMRVISGTSMNFNPTFYCTGSNPNITLRGMMTVLCKATDSYPLRICPCNKANNKYGVYNVEMKIVGDSTRCFRLCDYGESAAVGEVTNVVKFTGDLSGYSGTIAARKNVRVSLGGLATEMPGTLVLEDASARLTLDGISATVGTLRTTAASLVEIPAGKTLTVSNALELANGTSVTTTAGEPSLDLSACTSLAFGGTVNVSLAMDDAVEKTPLAVVKDMSAAISVISAFNVSGNGRKPMRLKAESTSRGVVVMATEEKGLIVIIR